MGRKKEPELPQRLPDNGRFGANYRPGLEESGLTTGKMKYQIVLSRMPQAGVPLGNTSLMFTT